MGLQYEGTIRNALRLLSIPNGYTHSLRYRRISDDTITQLKKSIGDKVLIILIDKFVLNRLAIYKLFTANILNIDINSNKLEIIINMRNEQRYLSGVFLYCKTAILSEDLIKMIPKHSILKHLVIIFMLLIYSCINVILASYQFNQASNILEYIVNYAPAFLNSIIFYILYLLNDRDKFL